MIDARTLDRINSIKHYQIDNLINEEWVSILGYEGLYMVSDLGRIKSIFRQVHGLGGKTHSFPEKLLSHQIDKFGYHRVPLRKNSKAKYFSVHRLVARHFISNPFNLPQVNHKKGNKSDNRATELEWCTASQNKKHSYDEFNHARMRGERNGMTKITPEIIQSVKEAYKQLQSFNLTGKLFGISNTHAWRIVRNKTWEHL